MSFMELVERTSWRALCVIASVHAKKEMIGKNRKRNAEIKLVSTGAVEPVVLEVRRGVEKNKHADRWTDERT